MRRWGYLWLAVVVLGGLVGVEARVRAENWPGWRGPRGDGTSLEKGLPVRWSQTENVVWKREVPYPGHASPVVWGEYVFLVGADEAKENRMLMAFDRRTGKLLWQRVVLHAPLETINRLNSYASSTPATDGKRIYVTFLEVEGHKIPAPNISVPRLVTPGRIFVAAYDFDGNLQWTARPGPFVSVHGFCSSPVLFEDLVIVNGDHDGDSYLVALDRQTGRIRWKTPRRNHTRSYCTPIIRTVNGRPQLMLSGDQSVCGYDPQDGSLIWYLDGPTKQFVASLVMTKGLVFVTGGYPEKHILALDPSGRGDITGAPYVKWHHQRASLVAYVPSPVAVGDYFYCVSDRGYAACYEATTGRILWQRRLGRRYSASLVAADGLIYFLDDDGICKVVRAAPEFELVSENRLEEPTYASIAVSDGQLFVRTTKHLYCIGRRGGSR